MGNIFQASEAVKLGIRIEKNGKDFYNALVAQTDSQKGKEVFQYLAGEEESHVAVFEKLLESTEKIDTAESYPGEEAAYINGLSADCVFTQEDKGAEIAKGISSHKDAIDAGIGFEKDSILFYEGMKKVVPEYDHKVIEELIKQEKEHLRQLSDLKKDI